MALVLYKRHTTKSRRPEATVGALGDAVMDADKRTLRALLWCFAAALQCLTRTMAIACALCLAAKHHRNAEPINTTLVEY